MGQATLGTKGRAARPNPSEGVTLPKGWREICGTIFAMELLLLDDSKRFHTVILGVCSNSFATIQLDLGSAHHAVYTGLEFPKQSQNKRKRKHRRVCKPQCFGLYQISLSAQLRGDVLTSTQELEEVVLRVAAAVEEKRDKESKCKEPWGDTEFQNLLYQEKLS